MEQELTANFQFVPERGFWAGGFKDFGCFICEASNQPGEKPVLLAPMASRQQLQPILDNPHLFDVAFVNAVRILVMQYDTVGIEYTDD